MKLKELLIVLALGIYSINMDAQRRELKTEDNGYQWYKVVSKDKKWGAEEKKGCTLIPLSRGYDFVCFHVRNNVKGYFTVRRNGKTGTCDITGKEIISPNKYDHVTYHEIDGRAGYYRVSINGVEGACDVTGKEIIPCQYKSVWYNSASDCFQYTNSAGKRSATGIKLDKQGRAYSSNIAPTSSANPVQSGKSGYASISPAASKNDNKPVHTENTDATTFGLKGKVKSCKMIFHKKPLWPFTTFIFSQKGEILSLKNEDGSDYVVESRFSDGKIKSVQNSKYTHISYNFVYDNHGRLIQIEDIYIVLFSSLEFTHHYTYDSEDRIIKHELKENNKHQWTVNYKYTKKDYKGNWIECECDDNDSSIKREIQYY